jgi:hypothetical protein
MVRWVVGLVGALVVGAGACVAALVVGMRTKSPRLLGIVRRFNRAVMNRLQRATAGRPGAYASVMRHRGRTSGRAYETPLVPFPIDGGFVIPLPYGAATDWVRNVLAHGSAELVTDGRTYALDRPEVVPTDAVGDVFPPGERRTHRWFGVTHCLRVRAVEADPA